ncbi:unnamed protein product [Taenia asiatica]|uniref:BEN domain-containing protein n=1 Tax=Taenia asiatica TaxID=60517 RepID=A0A0R3WFW6_TAEAS|nr:unnamed protein product [Taenia asiatica]
MESMTEPQSANETSASSLGLGAALAVAYDLTEDPNFSQPSYVHPETTSVPLASMAPQPGVIVLSKNPYYPAFPAQSQPVRYHAGDPYWAISGCPQLSQQHQQQQIPVTSAAALPMTAYLNPIPVSSPISCPRGSENGSFFLQSVPHPPPPASTTTLAPSTADPTGYVDGGPASESTMSTDSMLSVRSDTISTYPPTSEMGYTIKTVSQASVMPNIGHHGGSGVAGTNNLNNSTTSSTSNSRRHEDQRQAAVPSSGSDDGLYELSEEDVKEIDDMLTQNPQVTSSRHWKYYVETNEWTRATCALMACLFSRDQMANSTVLGRGGSQRERLPTNLVAYVVTKMRRRFNKSAAAVRARMAQKCKDERRFGRVLPSGTIATNSDRSHPSSSSTTCAASSSTITSSSSTTTSGNSSRQSALNRRRSAAYAAANTPLAKNPRLSLAPQPPPPPPLSMPPVAPTQVVATPTMLTSLPSEVYAPPSAVNSAPATASVVHDPPVILASAPEMAS